MCAFPPRAFAFGLTALATALALSAASNAQTKTPADTLEGQLAMVAAAIKTYQDPAAARKDGWRRTTRDVAAMGEHWSNRDERDYIGGEPLDFSRPTNLMYTTIDGEKVLTGVAFVVRIAEGEALPDGFAGSEDRWHVHNAQQVIDEGLDSRPLARWVAQRFANSRFQDDDGVTRSRLAMVHVWTSPTSPDGVFSDFNRAIPYLKLGLPATYADGASLDAAKGLHLATEDGCDEALDGYLWLADADRRQRRTLKDACADFAAQIRDNLDQPPATLNAIAENAWRFIDGLIVSVCSPEQLRRMASLKENGH